MGRGGLSKGVTGSHVKLDGLKHAKLLCALCLSLATNREAMTASAGFPRRTNDGFEYGNVVVVICLCLGIRGGVCLSDRAARALRSVIK